LAQLQLGLPEAMKKLQQRETIEFSYPSFLICNKIEDEIEQQSSNLCSLQQVPLLNVGTEFDRQLPYPINTRIDRR